eukprot:4823428-Heterocapsa_arctica.AAC.1
MKWRPRRSDNIGYQRSSCTMTRRSSSAATYNLHGRGVECTRRRVVRRSVRPSSTCGLRRCVQGLRLMALYVRGVRGVRPSLGTTANNDNVSGLPSGAMALDDLESRVPTMCGITSATLGCVGRRAREVHPVREPQFPQGEVDARTTGPSSEPTK